MIKQIIHILSITGLLTLVSCGDGGGGWMNTPSCLGLAKRNPDTSEPHSFMILYIENSQRQNLLEDTVENHFNEGDILSVNYIENYCESYAQSNYPQYDTIPCLFDRYTRPLCSIYWPSPLRRSSDKYLIIPLGRGSKTDSEIHKTYYVLYKRGGQVDVDTITCTLQYKDKPKELAYNKNKMNLDYDLDDYCCCTYVIRHDVYK